MKILQFDVETQTEILRDATDEEIAKIENNENEALAREAEAEAKATARQAVLDRLGLTAEEAKLILG